MIELFAEFDALNFAATMKVPPAEFAAQDELTRLRRQVREQEIDKMIGEGRVLPAFKEEVLSFAASLDDSEAVSFAEGKPAATRKDWFMSFLARQPQVVSFGTMDMPPGPGHGDPQPSSIAPDGYAVDPAGEELYRRARRIEAERKISFAEAVSIAAVETD